MKTQDVRKNGLKNPKLERGAGTVESMLLVFAGFFALSWGVGTIRKMVDEDDHHVRYEELAVELVKEAESAKVAGLNLVENTVSQTIENLEQGETVTYGFFEGQHYGIEKLDRKTRDRVEELLYINEGRLRLREQR